ncbi:MAG: NAD(P)H-dependent oxidoreductase [Candidatus Kapaibacterium sp.]|jgi:multimeric flavodoxin WrbA|nr:NAD(P)H-dependent oxidoreductase [Candidatus Kapabacteria bacterium]
MKVLIIDCIKQETDSQTRIVLDKFIEGISSVGGKVKIIPVSDLDIKPCFSCTNQSSFEYSDKCRCDDDMNKLYPDFRNCESWVFASHIDSSDSTNYLKNLLDRMEPLFQPIYTLDSGSVTFPSENKIHGKMILISSYEQESIQLAKKVSEHIESISFLFAKEAADNILFDKSQIKDDRLERIYELGRNFINHER